MRASLLGSIGAASFTLLLTLLVTSPTSAGINQWTNIGPNNNRVFILVVDPILPQVIYLVTVSPTNVQNSYKGTNNGTSWGSLNLTGTNVTGFGLEPTIGGHETLYAGTANTVLKSFSGGLQWTPVFTSPSDIFFNTFVVDPVSTGTIYSCTGNFGVMKSVDGGSGWGPANSGMTAAGVNILAIDPSDRNRLYLGTTAGLFKSTNGADTWVPINGGLPILPPPVNAIAINPLSSSTIYAGTSDGLFKSSNGGGSWSAVGGGLPTFDPTITALAIDPQQPARLYAGTFSGVYRSRNAGASWVQVNTGLANTAITNLAIDPQSPDTVYAGTEGGLFTITFQDPPQYNLTYVKTGAGSGTVTSNPPGIDCTDSCSAQFDINSRVDLHAAADNGSFFVGWTGACTGIFPDCTINPLNGDKSVTANFVFQTDQMVKVLNDSPWIYFSLQSAYNAAQNSKHMLAMNAEFTESVNFDQNKSVTLKGGYDSSFDLVTGQTTLHGSLTVSRGALTVADLVIF